MKCPNCGQEMESGYLMASALGARVLVADVSLRWKGSNEPHTEIVGDKLGIFGADMNMEASRCANCQIIAFHYVSRKKEEKHEFLEKPKAENYDYGDVEKYLR